MKIIVLLAETALSENLYFQFSFIQDLLHKKSESDFDEDFRFQGCQCLTKKKKSC